MKGEWDLLYGWQSLANFRVIRSCKRATQPLEAQGMTIQDTKRVEGLSLLPSAPAGGRRSRNQALSFHLELQSAVEAGNASLRSEGSKPLT